MFVFIRENGRTEGVGSLLCLGQQRGYRRKEGYIEERR